MKRDAGLLLILLFLSFAGLYGATRCPGVHLGDSGELTAAALRLDIAHPPGYPLYTLIARLFAASSSGTPAAPVNLLSALAGAAAVALFYSMARRWSGPAAALGASLLLGLSPLLWSQAAAAEVYTLFLLLFVAAMLLILRASDGGGLGAAGYAAGLAVAAHPLGAGLIPLLLLAPLTRRERTGGEIREMIGALLFALGAATIFLYLPIRSASNPPVDWGNPETVPAFFAHLFRTQYEGVPAVDFSIGPAFRRVVAGFRMLLGTNVPLPLIPLPFLGIAALFVRAPRRAIVPAAGLLLYGPVLLGALPFPLAPDRVEENQVFLLPLLVLLFYFLAAAAGAIAAALRGPGGRWLRFAPAVVLVGIAAFRFPDALAVNRYDRTFLPEAYAREMLGSLPPGAVLVAAGDDLLFPLLYLRAAQNLRPDVRIVNPEGTVFGGPLPRPGEGPRYYSFPRPGALPSGLLFREESSPPLRPPDDLPTAPRSERTVRASGPLRTFWVNALETRARSADDIEGAAHLRLAALRLAEGERPPPGDAGLRYAAASLLADRGRYDAAIDLLREIVPSWPGEPLPRLLLAELLLRTPNREEASSWIVDGDGASASSLARSAAVLYYMGSRDRAAALAARAIDEDRSTTAAYGLLQRIRWNEERWAASAGWGERFLEYDPASIETRRLAARALRNAGNRRRAERHYRKILDLAPDDPAAAEARDFLNR